MSCNRLISERLTSGGVQFADGRIHCNLCREGAVDDVETGREILEEVARFIEQEGFHLQGVDIPLKLVGSHELSPYELEASGPLRGLTSSRSKTRNNQIVEHMVEIKILYGLPAEEFAAVAAHELTHVWITLVEFPDLDRVDSEGLCEMMAYVWLSQQSDPRSRFYLKSMLRNENPIYGAGLQRALAAMQTHTPKEVANYARKNRRLPPGD